MAQKLKKRSDGRYRKIVDGIPFYGASEREVFLKIKNYNEEKIDGKYFSDVAAEWWTLEVESLSPSTVRGYKKATDRVVDAFGDKRIRGIQTADVSRFLYTLGKVEKFAKKTVKNHKIIINRIFHFAAVQGYILYNPAREAEIPRNLPSIKRLPATPEEEKKIANATADGGEIWLLPLMALFTGMRKGELRGLKWSDIDMTKKLIHVRRSVWDYAGQNIKSTKTESGVRMIPIPDILFNALEKLYKSAPKSHFVFGAEKPISEKKYRIEYKKFQQQFNITATAQQLRKSYATMAVGANLPADVLASIFGHKDITTTLNIYSQVRESRIIAAAEQINEANATQH